jgi:hypothetical protein
MDPDVAVTETPSATTARPIAAAGAIELVDGPG